jgi:hypothetical protein
MPNPGPSDPLREYLWYDKLTARTSPALVEQWPAKSSQLMEMAVDSGARRRGEGGWLHDELLAGLPTLHKETFAFCHHRRRGWQILIDRFLFEGVTTLLHHGSNARK